MPVGRLVSVGAVVFLANAALLVLQLVAGRLLSPFIGSSLETWTSIIGVFLAGIALGNAFGGKLADRYPGPRTLAILLVAGAVAALWMMLLPQLLASSGAHKSIPLTPRIPVLSAALCLPAGFVLSLLTPLAIKLGLPDVAHTGRVAGLIFALSTLGCLIGNYVTGFYLIPTFTVDTLVLASAGSLVALAGLSLAVVSQARRFEGTGGKGIENPGAPGPREGAGSPRPEGRGAGAAGSHAFPDIRRAYLIVFLASFCGMTLELTASRVLAQYLGVSLFTWTGIIGVMLAGTALGNFTGGQIADRPRRGLALLAAGVAFVGCTAAGGAAGLLAVHERDRPAAEYHLGIPARFWAKYTDLSNEEFAYRRAEVDALTNEVIPAMRTRVRVALLGGLLLGAVVGAAAAGLLARRGRVPVPGPNPRTVLAATLCAAGAATVFMFVTMALLTRFHAFDTWDPIVQVLVWTFSMFFLPMLVLGLVSPQVVRLAVPDVTRAGEVAGRVYAWSTTGAIVGTFAAGHVLLSSLGMYRTLLCAALLLTFTSLLVANFWRDTRAAIREGGPGAAAEGSGALLYLFSIVLGGVFGGFLLTGRANRDEGFVAQVESNYYTIKVNRDGGRDTALKLTLDHLVHSSVDPYHPEYLYYTHEHIQMEFLQAARAAAPGPKALVIGGGGYTFPRYAQELMPESHIDVVEIDPKVTQVARDYLGLKEYPNLRAVHMDGRQFVAEKAAPGTYDLVIQDAVNDLSVPAHLMTREYNDAVKATLKPGGAYLLTIIDSIAYGKLWKAAMATLAKSFPAGNVVLLTAEAAAGPTGTYAGDEWNQRRRVLVIYASDAPFGLAAVRDAVVAQAPPEARFHLAAASIHIGAAASLETDAELRFGLAAGCVAVGTAALDPEEVEWPPPALGIARYLHIAHTAQVAPRRLRGFTDREPGVVLTDQFCPIDNLMAEVFRQRYK